MRKPEWEQLLESDPAAFFTAKLAVACEGLDEFAFDVNVPEKFGDDLVLSANWSGKLGNVCLVLVTASRIQWIDQGDSVLDDAMGRLAHRVLRKEPEKELLLAVLSNDAAFERYERERLQGAPGEGCLGPVATA